MNAQVEYRITEGPQPEGSHWASMFAAGEDLQRQVDYMSAVLRCSREEGTATDWETVDLDPETDPGDVIESVNSWALEVRSAHWDGTRELARVVFLLGFGGPNVYLTVDCAHDGSSERITIERYWSGESTAYTLDSRALRVADDFLSLVIPEA